jgi:SAM-dependent methyltransferase
MNTKVQVYAVVRIDDSQAIEDAITVKEILPTIEQAMREVERLNKLNSDKGARYFWQATRYFPDGREVDDQPGTPVAPDVLRHNAIAWDAECDNEGQWSRPVSAEVIANASRGDWQVILTPNKPVPKDWFGDLKGRDVLCLASGGGQQGPILSAAGANVTVLDQSPKQLECDRLVAKRESLNIRLIRGDMADLSMLDDSSFDIVFHPCSNCFSPNVRSVWKESFRVLRTRGVLMSGFLNPLFYIFDRDLDDRGQLVVRHSLPYSDLDRWKEEGLELKADKGENFEFGHLLADQIGGQIDAGFLIAGFYEDYWSDQATTLNKYTPTFIATLALKPERSIK